MPLIPSDGFWYVATPYSKYPGGLDAAFEAACRLTAQLAEAGIPVHSPTAHGHPIAKLGNLDPVDNDFWVRVNAPMVRAASGIIVIRMVGWEESQGVQHEIETFESCGKPRVFWTPSEQIPKVLSE